MKPGDSPNSGRYTDQPDAASRERILAMALAVTFHLGVLWVVIHGFGGIPAMVGNSADRFTISTFDVPLDPPKPLPSPTAPDPAGASGEEGRKAIAKATVAKARVPVKVVPAPPVAATGSAVRSGASAQGAGTGGSGTGVGTGSGASGNGSGGGLARKAEKIAGDIRSTKDYPARTQPDRIGKRVVILLTVGTDGKVSACQIWRASGVPEADSVTCKLATDRFRFRPATDAQGNPVAATFGWEQRWFAP